MTTQTPSHGRYDQPTNQIFDANIERWVPADAFYAEYKMPTYSDADTKMPPMRQAHIVILAIAALLAAIAITALVTNNDTSDPDALLYNTSEQSYLKILDNADIAHMGAGDEQAALLETGYLACSLLDEGNTVDQIAMTGYDNSARAQGEAGMTYTQARLIVTSAQQHLC